MGTNGQVETLAWDSAWLGLSVGRAMAHTPQGVAEVVAASQAANQQLLYLVVDAAAEAAVTAAQATGAFLADVRLTYHKRLPAIAPAGPGRAPTAIEYQQLRQASPELTELAYQSSQYSRFRRDARIPAQACDHLYSEWLRQALASGEAWAALQQGTPVGLLTMGTRQGHASIELLAVSPAARHQGIGQRLINVAQQEASRQGHQLLQVVTQQANLAAQLFYEHCGFQLTRRQQVFHLWLKPE